MKVPRNNGVGNGSTCAAARGLSKLKEAAN